MKPILLVFSLIAAFSLAGCASSLSQFESGAASLGTHSQSESNTPQVETLSSTTPVAGGTIAIPQSPDDLKQSSDGSEADPEQQNAKAATPVENAEEPEEIDEQNLTDEERHRLELINRGDLDEDEALPKQ